MSHASAAMSPGAESHPPLLFHSLAPAPFASRRDRASATALASVPVPVIMTVTVDFRGRG